MINIKKYLFFIIIFIILFSKSSYIYATDNYMQNALDEVNTDSLDNYLRNTSDFFSYKNITIKQLISDAMKGKIEFNLMDFFSYQIEKEKDFIKQMVLTSINILVICIVLTVIKYFSEEISGNNVSNIVGFISIIFVFILATTDINFVKDILKREFLRFDNITQNINSLF